MEHRAFSTDVILAGIRYVWSKQLLLGSISLDLFAVLLGGAVALMPIFAQEILHTRSEEHTSELQSRQYLVCRLLLEKKKNKIQKDQIRREKRLTNMANSNCFVNMAAPLMCRIQTAFTCKEIFSSHSGSKHHNMSYK